MLAKSQKQDKLESRNLQDPPDSEPEKNMNRE